MGKDKKRKFNTNWSDTSQAGTGSGSLFGEGGYFQARKAFESEYGMTPHKYKKLYGGMPDEGFLPDEGYGIVSSPSIDQNLGDNTGGVTLANVSQGDWNKTVENMGTPDHPSTSDTYSKLENLNNEGLGVFTEKVADGESEDKGGGGMGMSSAQMGAVGDIAGGIGSIVSGIVGGGKRRAEQAAAESEYNKFKNRFDNLSTANVYRNVNNPYEDLTVNLKQANFQAQQQQQGLSNTMRSLQGAAGGSGIAALAQAMSNQQGQNLQQISANIGQQESANQRLKAQGAMQAQMAERQGELMSNQMEAQKTATQLGRSDERLREANAAREQATKALVGGVAQLGMGIATGGASGMFSSLAKNGGSWFDGSRQ